MDLAALERYLAPRVEGLHGPLSLRAFEDGQSNPTFLLTAQTGRYVLRKKPPGRLLKSAHAVDREFRVQAALRDTGVPVAEMLHLCLDESVLGTAFYLMEYLPGRVFWDPALPELDNDGRARVYDQMNRVLAVIHDVDPAVVGLDDFGPRGDYFARQLGRWARQYRSAGHDPVAGMDALIGWLELNLPPDDGQTRLVHGDYRIDNLLFAPDSLTIRAVFDWELSTLGHPLADLAYVVMQRGMGRDWHLRGLAGLDTAAMGIPSERAFVEAYCARRGIGFPEHWRFARVFAHFRFAAICHGVGARAAAGNNASPHAPRVGAMAAPLVQAGLSLIT